MKNAYVIEDHYGDDGTATEGMILTDVTAKRFEELEKKGLVREATAAEVKAGSQHKIDADPTPDDEADPANKGGDKDKQAPANKKAADPANKGG